MLSVALLCMACALYWIWTHRSTDTHEPQHYPGGVPLKDHVLALVGHRQGICGSIRTLAWQSYLLGGIMTAKIGFQTIYVITDPDIFYTIADTCITKHDDAFNKTWEITNTFTEKLSKWNFRPFYHLLNPSFLDTFISVFNVQSRTLVKELEQELSVKSFDHWNHLKSHALEIITLTALGNNPKIKSNHVEETIYPSSVVDRLIKFWLSPMSSQSRNLKRKYKNYLKNLHSLLNIIKEQKLSPKDAIDSDSSVPPGKPMNTLLDFLLELPTKKRMLDDTAITNHLEKMIVHGSDSLAAALAFTIVLLGSHPDVQDKVVSELHEVLSNGHEDIVKEDLSRLEYLEAVIKESMRLYPVMPVIARKPDKDINIQNYTLSAGRSCCFLYNVHNQPLIWGPTVHEFKPERWLDPSKLTARANACVFFGVGGQMCLGKAYTFMLMKTTLAHVLRRFIVTADHTQMKLQLEETLQPASGHHINIEIRSKS